MDHTTIATFILLGSFILLILIRVPVAFATGISSVLTVMYLKMPLMIVAQNMVQGVNKYPLMAVPFFILAGEVMGGGGISTRLVKFANALVGWLRGGLAIGTVVSSMFFGGISGSSVADTASIGSIVIPMMEQEGYEAEFATNVTMASSVQGILIPPSQNMVIFAMVAGTVSVGRLFLAGVFPGIFLGAALMVYCYVIAVKRNYPKGQPFSIMNVLRSTLSSIWGLCTVLIVVAGVVTGKFTATESAAIAVVWAIIVSFFIYKEMNLRKFWDALGSAISTLSIVLILISSSYAFAWLLTSLKVPEMVITAIFATTKSKFIITILMLLIMLFLGMIMDMSPIILVATPILLPVAIKIGMDPVQFGVIMMLNLGIGLLTPPVGSTLFVGSAISKVPIEKLAKTLVPFYLVMIFVLLVITFFPEIVMYLPNKVMPVLGSK